MASKKTDDTKPKCRVIMRGLREPSAEELRRHTFITPPAAAPPLDSPEFDLLAKAWLEELIRRAKAKGPAARATNAQAPPSLTIRARGEGSTAFDVCITNVYDLEHDPLELMVGLKEVSRDALEAAIREAGFGGWVAPRGPGMKGPISAVFNISEGVDVAPPLIPNVSGVVH